MFTLVLFIPFYFLGRLAEGAEASTGFSIPTWVWVAIFISIFLWLARGKRIEIPEFSFKSWVIANLVVTPYSAGWFYLPGWVMVSVCYAPSLFVMALDDIAKKGRARLTAERCDDGSV